MTHLSQSSSFFEDINETLASVFLLDMLPDTIACIKDASGVYRYVNRAFAATLQKDTEEIIGQTDASLFSPELARIYTEDDKRLMQTAQPIHEKAELVTHRPGLVRWYITNKVPLKNKSGVVVGLAGLSRPSNSSKIGSIHGPMASISKAVDFVYENVDQPISVVELSTACGSSISSLERHFKKHFGCTPGRFIVQVKVSTACEKLADPSYSIYEIASQTGYQDPAIFSRVFKREMRMSPSAYRNSIKLL